MSTRASWRMRRMASLLLWSLASAHCRHKRAEPRALPAASASSIATADASVMADASIVVDAPADAPASDATRRAIGQGDHASEDEEQPCQAGVEPPDPTASELAQAATRPDAPDVLTESMVAEDGAAMDAWILTRVRHARAGQPERVRLLLTQAGGGWGCRCPSHFIAGDTDSHGPGAHNWLDVIWSGRSREPSAGSNEDGVSTGWQVWVEGRFTGARTVDDFRDSCGQPPDYFYRPWSFEVLARYRRSVPDTEVARVLR